MNRINNFVEEQKKELANQYKGLIDVAHLEEAYVEAKTLQLVWGVGSTRKVRYIVEDVLHLYLAGYLPKLIIGTHYGYIYSNDAEIVEPYLKKKEQHWKSECVNCYYLQKRFRNKDNMTMKDYVDFNI